MNGAQIKKRYYTVKQMCAYTGLPASTLYEWAAQGTIPSIKIGKRLLFDIADVDRVFTDRKRNETETGKLIKEIIDDVDIDL